MTVDELARIRFAAKQSLEKGYPKHAHLRPYGDDDRFFEATTGVAFDPRLVSDAEGFRENVAPVVSSLVRGAYRVSIVRTVEPVLVTADYAGLEPNMPALELLVIDKDAAQQWFMTDRSDLWFGPETENLPAAVSIIQELIR